MIIEKHILITDDELSLVATLKNELDLPISQIKQAIGKGCLWIEKDKIITRLRRFKTKLKSGQQLHFYYNSAILEQSPLQAELIEDNQAYSIWHKPAGMLCQGSKWGDHTTINRFVEKNLKPERPAIIVHRLDKMTSGLLILAHQKKVAAAFGRLFEQRKIKKCYRAQVHGLFDDAPVVFEQPVNNKPAISRVQLLEKSEKLNQSLLRICIDTGRKHQIRQHLATAGFPVVGDRLFGHQRDSESVAE
ncbi:MAG: RNA pseudouridine synthase, partial [Gammaproteobacteria bacterium]